MTRNQIIWIVSLSMLTTGVVVVVILWALGIFTPMQDNVVEADVAEVGSPPVPIPEMNITNPCVNHTLQIISRAVNSCFNESAIGGVDGVIMWLSNTPEEPVSAILVKEQWRSVDAAVEADPYISMVWTTENFAISPEFIAPISSTRAAMVAKSALPEVSSYVCIADTSNGTYVNILENDSSPVAIAFDAAQARLMVVWYNAQTNNGVLVAYETISGTKVAQYNLSSSLDYAHVALHVFSLDMVLGFSGSAQVLHYRWNDDTWDQVTSLVDTGQFGHSVALHPSGDMLAVGDPISNGRVFVFKKDGIAFSTTPHHIWEANAPFYTFSLQDHMGTTVAWVNDRIYAGKMGYPVVMDLVSGAQTEWAPGEAGSYLRLFSSTLDARRSILGVEQQNIRNVFSSDDAGYFIISPDSTYMFIAYGSSVLKRSVVNGGVLGTIPVADVSVMLLSHDETKLFTSSYDGVIHVWEADTGILIHSLTGHSDTVLALALSLDNTYLYSGSVDHTIRKWQVSSGTSLLTMSGHTGWIRSLCLSSNGERLYSGSADNTVRIWNTSADVSTHTLTGHNHRVNVLQLSWDETILYSGSQDMNVKEWDALSGGAALRTFYGHTATVKHLFMSSDGTTLLSYASGSLRYWRLSDGVMYQNIPTAAFVSIMYYTANRDIYMALLEQGVGYIRRWGYPLTTLSFYATKTCE